MPCTPEGKAGRSRCRVRDSGSCVGELRCQEAAAGALRAGAGGEHIRADVCLRAVSEPRPALYRGHGL